MVLKELESYLQQHYSWCDDDVKKYSLHAFGEKCYSDDYPSYDSQWLKLIASQPKQFDDGQGVINIELKISNELSVLELVRIFDNPLKDLREIITRAKFRRLFA